MSEDDDIAQMRADILAVRPDLTEEQVTSIVASASVHRGGRIEEAEVKRLAAQMAQAGKLFTCSVCRETFTSDRPDEEAKEEFAKNFAGAPVEEAGVVCTVCFEALKGGFPS